MVAFGDFQPLCSDTPSYPWCNLFYRQLQRDSQVTFDGRSLPASSAPVGVNPTCGIPRINHKGSAGNVANIVVCGASVLFVAALIWMCNRRKAAVGRIELCTFFTLYLLTLTLQLLTTGALLEQGTMALVVLTAIHAGAVVALFGALLANAIVATQVVEDGTLASLVPFYIFTFVTFAVGLYISLDIGLGFTDTIGGASNPPEALRSIVLFVLTSIWPVVCAIAYLILMSYIVLHVLNERSPLCYYVIAAALFMFSQLAWFLLSRVICNGSNAKVDGSFLATLLETAAVGVLYLAWKSITEDSLYPPVPADHHSKKLKRKQLRSGKAPDIVADARWEDGRSTDFVILIMGQTGTGKSTFVNYLAGREAVRVGHDLDPCTNHLQSIVIQEDEPRLVIVDTPGFNSTSAEDSVILRRIAVWLSKAYHDMTLGGVLYLHEISQSQELYAPPKFLKFLANNAPESVVLVTTKWEEVSKDIGETRETQLRTSWKEMLAGGSQIKRFDGSSQCAKAIVKLLQEMNPQPRLKIQDLDDLTEAEKNCGNPSPSKKNWFFGRLRSLFAERA